MINENSTFGGFLTDIGEAKQANANALEIPWKLTHMLLGDANGTDPVPDPGQTQLVNQVHRAAINQLSVDPENPAILIAELVLPPNVGGWWIRELGLEDEDGDFVAVANCPPSYKPLLAQGSGRNQVVRMHLILSNTANVQLKIDPSVVLATRQYADNGDNAVAQAAAQALQEHEQGRDHPAATTQEQGMVRLATETQHIAGEAADRAAHPAGVKAAIQAYAETVDDQLAAMVGETSVTGFRISNDEMTPGSVLHVSPGEAAASNKNFKISAATNLQFDIAIDGPGGMDEVDITWADQTLHVYVIGDSDGNNATNVVGSLSSTGPTLPIGFDAWRRIYSVAMNAGEIPVVFQLGDQFWYDEPLPPAQISVPSGSNRTLPVQVPEEIESIAIANIAMYYGGSGNHRRGGVGPAYVSAIPSGSANGVLDVGRPDAGAVRTRWASAQVAIPVRADQPEIHVSMSGGDSATFYATTLGWIDHRSL